MKIIAYPFAGGSTYSYARLAREHAHEWITFDPPGHGSNMRYPLLHSIPEMVTALLEPTLRATAGSPYILFGHSMGAYIALAMLDRLVELGASPPQRLVLSGAAAPHRRALQRHAELPHKEFLEWVANMGGISAEVLAEPQLMELFEPILRADIGAAEAYFDGNQRQYDVPVRVLLGLDDRIALADGLAWADCFVNAPEVHCFAGGHFFLFDEVEKVQSLIA
ncbi:thioesterase II family protein [Undibacterium umbellatum]|uniref:Thioesterase n=1 Tax=Undibacterium umbellatum TaxID=2762300 RepID=A0ABR6Z727_9BURK|nr:alpha/beta fold hydrolase [Undibacterium umbellatum]MBC3907376.1 thioesterase [Undibacterium umbellatum]